MHVDRNDVFWMIPVRHDAVEVDFDAAHARLRVRNLSVFDDHDLANSLTQGLGTPTIPGVFPVPATVSFDVEWNGALDTQPIANSTAPNRFKGDFLKTGATIVWSAKQAGFEFQSDNPADPGANLISVLGHEQNGVFF